MTPPPRVGIVVIGRNEGERLRRCLESLAGVPAVVVYVDSGSSDGSPALAEGFGVTVVLLDAATRFTAARARNAGFERLSALVPAVDYVQFVDGDCEVAAGWIDAAVAALDQDPSVAVVCGRRRERRRAASIYNRLCDMEWNTAPGWTDSCGGDAMMRAAVLTAVGGYDSSLIAGEEPDLCHRIRERGHRVRRLDAEMTTHDAAMTRFGQWWKRTVRAGHAAAENHARHHAGIGTAATRRLRSSALWGGLLPGLVVAGVITGLCLGSLRAVLLVLAAGSALVAVQIVRIWRGRRRRGDPAGDAWLYAWFCILGKVPELQGALTYARHRHAGVEGGLIEYKGAPSGSPGPGSPSPGRPGSA